MRAPTSGLARITIRAPRRRLDLAVPHQVPLAELMPEVLRRAGEVGTDLDATRVLPGGWILRRGDGENLTGDAALAHQGVRDGDVLYLVPRHLDWPEPAYDDVVEEMAERSRSHGQMWDATGTRLFCLLAAGLVLLTGLGLLLGVAANRTVPGLIAAVVAAALLAAGTLLSRALGDGVAGAATAGLALPYAAASGVLLVAGAPQADPRPPALPELTPQHLLVAASALLLASVVGAVAVGYGLRIFAAGVTVALFAGPGALLGLALSGAGAASIVTVALVAGIGLAPLVAVRLGRVPFPVVSAVPEIIAAEPRPDRAEVHASVVRADDILAGCMLGISVCTLGCVAVLALGGGVAAPLLASLACLALTLRARLFPSVAARLPLLASGLVGLAATAVAALSASGAVTRLTAVFLGMIGVVVLLTTAVTAPQRRGRASPRLARLGDILDVVVVIALAPMALAVLDLYSWVRNLAG